MDLDHRAGLLLLLLCLLLLGAAATRQLEAEPEATKGSRDPGQTLTYREAVSNSSCHGFLIGIGTQKGVLTQPLRGPLAAAPGCPTAHLAAACVLATFIFCMSLRNAFFQFNGILWISALPSLTVLALVVQEAQQLCGPTLLTMPTLTCECQKPRSWASGTACTRSMLDAGLVTTCSCKQLTCRKLWALSSNSQTCLCARLLAIGSKQYQQA
jgi:hypothetical protein